VPGWHGPCVALYGAMEHPSTSSPKLPATSGLRARLLFLVTLAVVPSLGLILYTAWEARQLAAADLQQHLLRLVRVVSTDHQSLVEGTRHLLIGLAQLREIRDREPACTPIVAELQRQDPTYANLGAVAPDGTLFCSAVPAPGRINVKDRLYFLRAVETRGFVAGEYQVGRATGKPTINFAYPVYDQRNQLHAVLFAAVDLAWLDLLSARATWPAGAVVSVLDQNGTILARYPDPGRWVGQSARGEPAFQAIQPGQGEGTFETPGTDGKPELVAFASLGGATPMSPVYYVLSISKTAAFANIDRTLARNLGALALVVLLGLAGAWGIGELFVVKRVRRIVGTTRRLASGDLAARTGLSYGGELGELAGAVDDMAVRLETRDAEAARAQAEILRQREALYQAEKVAGMGSLLAGVAHELNNPLSVVLGRAQLLRQLAGPGPMAPHVEKIEHAAERCARIVRNFLALARRGAPERQLTQINAVIGDAVELIGYSLRCDNVEVTLELAPDLPMLWADVHQLQQMVINLVTNAHHALREAPLPRRLTLATRHDAGLVTIEIADTGPGIAPELQARIFDPFFTTKPVGEGTGLGLPLCQGIVESHNGTIRFESAPGAGARFIVTLPIGAPQVSRVPDGPPGPVVRCKRVLIVDDEPDVAETLTDLLRLDGHIVESAGTGLAALERLAGTDYDLVLSDMRMPDLTGAGLYREVERLRPELLSRFVFLTGDTLSAGTAAFLEGTGAPTIMKPFDVADVRRVIQRLLGAGNGRHEPDEAAAVATPELAARS
jgi:signal transduction histidine kinase/FixJ family two-component response regulator